MIIKALPEALRLWEHPEEMIASWGDGKFKTESERAIATLVGEVGTVADCGCGPGRFATVLCYKEYYGFDMSLPMLNVARQINFPEVHFSAVDIFNFVSGRRYDVALLIDVAQHQEDSIEALERWLSLWDADRYIFTVLVGKEKEMLLNSVVASEEDFEYFISRARLRVHSEMHVPVGNEKFHALVEEVSKG